MIDDNPQPTEGFVSSMKVGVDCESSLVVRSLLASACGNTTGFASSKN